MKILKQTNKQTNKLKLLACAILGLFIFSCQQEDNVSLQNDIQQVTKEVDSSKLIDFKGLPVKHRFSTPTNELEIEHNYEELKKIYNKKRAIFNKGTSSSEELPDAELLVAEAEEHVKDYPLGDTKTDEEKWKMIQNDFPTLTEEQIADNIDLIDDYYSQNLDYETIAGLANKNDSDKTKLKAKYGIAKKSSELNRLWCILTKIQNPAHMIVPYYTYGRYRTGEFSYIRSIISIHYATKEAKRYSESEYSNLFEFDTKRDAYRHVMYSALLAKHYWTVSSKSKRLKFAEAVGFANEACGGNLADGKYMDFHNNKIGLDLFDKNTSYKKKKVLWFKITYGLKLPSNSKLRDLTKSLVNRGRFIDNDGNKERNVRDIKNTRQNQVVYISNKKK